MSLKSYDHPFSMAPQGCFKTTLMAIYLKEDGKNSTIYFVNTHHDSSLAYGQLFLLRTYHHKLLEI